MKAKVYLSDSGTPPQGNKPKCFPNLSNHITRGGRLNTSEVNIRIEGMAKKNSIITNLYRTKYVFPFA